MKKQMINNEYIRDYNSGLSIWKIAEKYSDTYKNVSEAISGHRFEARLLPINEKEKICDLYNSGMSTVKIGEMYGVNNKPISVVLQEYGINRSQSKMVRKYKVNEEYFDVIDSPNKAYIIGFLSADGCNYPKKSTISMSLEECDKEILEKICLEMDNQHPLEYIDYTNKNDFGYSYKNQYRMLIFSSHMCEALNKVGVSPNKSLSLSFSKMIPEEYLADYVRGVFDGDGSIGIKDLSTYNGTLSVSITSTYDFCYELKNRLLDNLGIYSRINEASNHNGITSCISISKKDDIKRFLDWIYNDAALYLKRKHDVYVYHYNINNSLAA